MKPTKDATHPYLVQTSLGNRFLSEREMLSILESCKPRGRRRQPIELPRRAGK